MGAFRTNEKSSFSGSRARSPELRALRKRSEKHTGAEGAPHGRANVRRHKPSDRTSAKPRLTIPGSAAAKNVPVSPSTIVSSAPPFAYAIVGVPAAGGLQGNQTEIFLTGQKGDARVTHNAINRRIVNLP